MYKVTWSCNDIVYDIYLHTCKYLSNMVYDKFSENNVWTVEEDQLEWTPTVSDRLPNLLYILEATRTNFIRNKSFRIFDNVSKHDRHGTSGDLNPNPFRSGQTLTVETSSLYLIFVEGYLKLY